MKENIVREVDIDQYEKLKSKNKNSFVTENFQLKRGANRAKLYHKYKKDLILNFKPPSTVEKRTHELIQEVQKALYTFLWETPYITPPWCKIKQKFYNFLQIASWHILPGIFANQDICWRVKNYNWNLSRGGGFWILQKV